ncbi:MAG: hypothetical protein K2O86_01050, partial [Clostridia bacterium]|nr:hypothetical protein [Clostridia bacterium]
TVEFSYGSTTKSDSILINVLPISVDTSKAKFENKVVIYDGTDKDERIGEVTWSGARPSQITGVTYIYTLDGAIVEESSLKGLGDYIVQAVFTMRSKDFYADPLIATLSIRSPTALEKPTFTGGVTYDGTEKSIEDYLDGYDSDYMQIVGSGATGTEVGRYTVTIQLTDGNWSDGTTGNVTLNWTIDKATLIPEWDNWEFIASDTSNGFAPVISDIAQGLASGDSVDYATDFIYKIYDEEGNALSESEVSEVGSYKIVASINANSALYKNYQFDGASNEWSFVVVPQAGMEILTIEWSDTEFLYDGQKHIPTYVVKDRNGNEVENAQVRQILAFDNYEEKTEIATYTVKVTVKDSDRYFIRSGAICKFKIVEELGDEPPEENDGTTTPPSGEKPSGSGIGSIEDIIKYFKEYPLWQIIASVISIILIMIFLTKTAGYNSKRKKYNKKAEKLDTVYSVVWGLPMVAWTGIACTLMGLAVVSFVIMLISKKRCNDAEEEYEERKEEYDRNKADFDERKRDENMQMMFMRMMGAQGANMGAGGGQGGYTVQQGIGVDEMRGLISETVTAMLPGVQQMLPQQASTNDELVGKLIEQNEKLMQQLAEQKSSEKIIEREVASSSVNEETIQRLIDKNDERIEKMMKTQESLIEKLLEKDNAPQVVEKVIEKEVPVEKIVEKVVEVPVEVEKVVEKEVVKEVPVEVEKIVEKEVVKEVKVEVPVKAPAKPKKEVAPRLTLDEAYALLTKEQKKYFDGLREYALTKYKCKEKKSTYFVVYGQTTTNPLLKLTIKKDTTVALLKMEDEYMKDLRRDATGDGTKVKVKETEVLVSDAQAFETAKKMVDLRYDQIERYQDLLREQRAMKK